LFAIDQLAAHDPGPAPSAYHSDTMTPSRTTTTPWVFMPSANAYSRAPSRTAGSIPWASGASTSHSPPGTGPAGWVVVGAGLDGVPPAGASPAGPTPIPAASATTSV